MKLPVPEQRNVKPAPPGRKSASGDFFADPNQRAWELPPQAQLLCREKWPSPATTASGRGLWLSADPIAENGGLNLYAYVGNYPVNAVDPDGLEPLKGYRTFGEAIQAAANDSYARQKETGYEAGAVLVKLKNGQYAYTELRDGYLDTASNRPRIELNWKDIPKQSVRVGDIHTHPHGDTFSTDVDMANGWDDALRRKRYLVNPDGTILSYDPVRRAGWDFDDPRRIKKWGKVPCP